ALAGARRVVAAVALLGAVLLTVTARGALAARETLPGTRRVARPVTLLGGVDDVVAAERAALEDADRQRERARSRQAGDAVDGAARRRRNAERRREARVLRSRRPRPHDGIEEAVAEVAAADLIRLARPARAV